MTLISIPLRRRRVGHIVTRQALLIAQHPRLRLPAEMVGERSIAVSTRRIMAAGQLDPNLLNGYDPRLDAHHMLTRLEQHLGLCEQLLDSADIHPPLMRSQLRRSAFALHARVMADIMESARALAELADELDRRRAAVA